MVVFVALFMVMSLTSTVMAEGDATTEPTGTITIKLPTQKQEPTSPVTYKIYKVFDATVSATDNTKVSYKLCTGDALSAAMTAAGFSVDSAGNVSGPAELNDAAIAAIAAYVTDSDLVDTVVSEVKDKTVTSDDLPYGYYYITTTTGTVVTIDTNNNNPTVDDKNIIPSVVKSAGSEYSESAKAAIAAVGTDQPYTAVITKTKGAYGVSFADEMTNQTYNGDLEVTVGGNKVAPSTTTYTVEITEKGFKVTFADDYIASLADDTQITLKYSAKITSDALFNDPATNTATLNSGNSQSPNSSTDEVKVYNAKMTVSKQDGEKKPLAGAGFVVAQTVADTSEGAEEGATKTVYYTLTNNVLTWVDSIDDADVHTSDSEGNVPAFTGLGVGKYVLIEKVVPEGYNKADDQPFEVKDGDVTSDNLQLTATVTNNSGAELPSTGGIGTTIFHVLGGALVLGAGVILVAKKRVNG